MKKVFQLLAIALVGFSLTGCEYDDSDLWNEMDDVKNRVTALEEAVKNTNDDIIALQTIVDALQKNVYVTTVKENGNGYTITFSDGNTATISNGKDGANMPTVSIRQDTDGNYYWTIDGEWLIVDGEKVRANGKDGENGKDGADGKDGEDGKDGTDGKDGENGKDGADGKDGENGKDGADGKDGANGKDGKDGIAPQVRINDKTKEWEISTDGGNTWTSTGVMAEGKEGATGESGSSIFKSVDASNANYIVITLADGTVLRLARYDETAPVFIIENAPQVALVEYGKNVEYTIKANNIADFEIIKPQCWNVTYADNKLCITAPSKDACHFDKEGTIAFIIVSDAGKSAIVKLKVMAGEWVDEAELRTLTFEDKDARFSTYSLDYAGVDINTWSDLVDDPQYGGPLTYGDMYSTMYTWWDENNTELMHLFPSTYGSYCYWSGGQAISNYWGAGYTNEDRNRHIARYYGEDYVSAWEGNDTMLGWFNVQLMTPVAPHSGDNFAVHFGYIDFFSMVENLPEISFADGEARVIDHMYVTNTNYTLNQLVYGVGSEAGNSFGGEYAGPTEDSWFKITALGFASWDDEEPTSEVDFYLLNGTEPIVDWQKWDLTALGRVVRVQFNMSGSDDMTGSYGMTIPAYFAYDDVAVQFGSKRVFK